jgi:hypothetical protein
VNLSIRLRRETFLRKENMKDELKTRVAKDGTMLGDPVPRSKYYRTFCWSCGEPMRTTMENIMTAIYCEECNGGRVDEYVDLRDLHEYPSQEGRSRGERSGGDMNDDEIFEQKIRRKW